MSCNSSIFRKSLDASIFGEGVLFLGSYNLLADRNSVLDKVGEGRFMVLRVKGFGIGALMVRLCLSGFGIGSRMVRGSGLGLGL